MSYLEASHPDSVRRSRKLRTRAVVGWTCLAVVAVRLVFVTQPLRSDEGGYLYAARHWGSAGEFLYGDLHVDRPPLLMMIFRLAALTEWDGAIRVLSIAFTVATVLGIARGAFLLAGDRGARWAAVLAAALLVSPALAADQADGELFAVAFVAWSVALALDGWRRHEGAARWWLAVAAGTTAVAASLVKQNFLEGLVFVGVLVLAETLREHRLTSRAMAVGGGALIGAVAANVALYAWAAQVGIGAVRLWTQLGAFRQEAWSVIWRGSSDAPLTRAVMLVGLAGLSAILALVWTCARAATSRWRHLEGEEWAIGVCLVFGGVSIVAGGSFWAHYLIGLVPMLSLGVGVVAATSGPAGRAARRWTRVAVGSALVLVVAEVVVYAVLPRAWSQQRTGEWVAGSSEPGDTAVVLYGAPSILEAGDIGTPYPYLWSLPMRTLDPRQERLRRVLAGPDAPTWIVQVSALNSWRIDESGLLRELIEARYDRVAAVCGFDLWLLAGESRTLAPPPRC